MTVTRAQGSGPRDRERRMGSRAVMRETTRWQVADHRGGVVSATQECSVWDTTQGEPQDGLGQFLIML